MRSFLVYVLFVLCLSFALLAQAEETDRQPASGVTSYASGSIKRVYPGGRDDSDLTVQPAKRVTKKETDLDRTDGVDEGDLDQGDAAGFGE
jgi:hypothetical protein